MMSFKFCSRLAPLALLCLGVLGGVSLSGCGSGDSGSSAMQLTTTRHATSTVNLASPFTAVLDINVATDASVTGTMTIHNNGKSVVTGTYNITGSVATNGDLNLTASYTPAGGATMTSAITGNLGSTAGNLVLNYLGANYTGSWTVTTSVTGGPGTGTGTGGSTTIAFSNATGANATTTNRNFSSVPGVITTVLGVKSLVISASATGTGDTNGTLVIGLLGTPAVGTYAIDNDKYSVTYAQGPLGNPIQWHASGGMLQIVSVDASKVSFKIIGAAMVKDTASATGTFTLDSTGETTSLVTF